MTFPQILTIETGVPANRYSQQNVLEYYLQQGANQRERAIRGVFNRAGVGYRHMVVDEAYFALERTTQERNDLYMHEAVPLAANVVTLGLEKAGLSPQDIDDLVVVSCTGFSVPGLDLQLAGALKMRSDLQRTCVLGMGCYGAFPGMRRAMESVKANPARKVLVLALELCSVHLQSDYSSESVVSSALFADGAAMLVIGDESSSYDEPGVRLLNSKTYCDYSTLEHMSFTVTDHGFRMYLSSYVPDLLAAKVEGFVDQLLREYGLERSDVRYWAVHPGSTKIIDYVQSRLSLTDAQVEYSHSVLYNYGNMSSPTVLFILEHIQRCSHPTQGDYGVLLAFGPGLTMEGLLVQW